MLPVLSLMPSAHRTPPPGFEEAWLLQVSGGYLAVLGCFWTSPGTFGYLHTFQPGATSLQHLLPAVRRLHRLHSAQGSPPGAASGSLHWLEQSSPAIFSHSTVQVVEARPFLNQFQNAVLVLLHGSLSLLDLYSSKGGPNLADSAGQQ